MEVITDYLIDFSVLCLYINLLCEVLTVKTLKESVIIRHKYTLST